MSERFCASVGWIKAECRGEPAIHLLASSLPVGEEQEVRAVGEEQEVGHDRERHRSTCTASSTSNRSHYWLNSKNGVVYSMAIQTPQYNIDSIDALGSIPINAGNQTTPQLFENLASMKRTDEPAVVSHYNVLPVVDIFASTQGRDMGGVGADIAQITFRAQTQLPAGSTLVTRGQVATMALPSSGSSAGSRLRSCSCTCSSW
jgi:hypothetical protein